MNKIAIVTDSTSDIPGDICRKNNIYVIPLFVNFGDKSYVDDGVDITKKQFYEKLENVTELPKSAQPTPADFIKLYERLLKDHESIISIHISKKMSGTISSALTAKKEFPGKDITVIDSELVHLVCGAVVIKAAEMAQEGRSKEEILDKIDEMKSKVRVLFIPKTLKYLKMGGRIGKAKGLIASLLEIRPILSLSNGEVSQYKTTRRFNQARIELINSMKNMVSKKESLNVIVSDSNSKKDGDDLAESIKEEFGLENVMRAEIGVVVGTHLGPGGIAAIFWED
jgi:DegV family protein with EDD domain